MNSSELEEALETEFEPILRHNYDHYLGELVWPVVVLMAHSNLATGEESDAPRAVPVDLTEVLHKKLHTVMNYIRGVTILSKAVASFICYPEGRSLMVRCETPSLSYEWVIPVLTNSDGSPYLGKRIPAGYGKGLTAKYLDDRNPFGGVFPKHARKAIEA